MANLPIIVPELANFLIPAGIFALLALGLNIQWGHTGLFNAGIAGFLAIGAYTAAILMTAPPPFPAYYPGHIGGFSQSFAVAALGAMAMSGLAGLLIAIPILRLRADYFAIATLALAEVIRLVLMNAESLTGGSLGVILIPRPFDAYIGGDREISDVALAILVVGLVLVVYAVLEYFTRSPWGRVLRGIREDEEATLALGKNVYWFRLQSFVLGCVVMGLAGAVLSTFLGVIGPAQFDPLSTFTIYVMVILGGSGNNRGVVLGAFLYYSFDWVSSRLKDIPQVPESVAGQIPYLRLMIIGVILVLLVMYRPEGILREKKGAYPPVK